MKSWNKAAVKKPTLSSSRCLPWHLSPSSLLPFLCLPSFHTFFYLWKEGRGGRGGREGERKKGREEGGKEGRKERKQQRERKNEGGKGGKDEGREKKRGERGQEWIGSQGGRNHHLD